MPTFNKIMWFLLGIILALICVVATTAYAATPVTQVVNGGTGVGTFTAGNLLYGNLKSPLSSVATSSASCSSGVSCSSFTVVGGVSPSITNTGALSVFGRAGAVVATVGDYTSAQITEVTNLFFTNARAIAATLTGYISGAGTISATDTVLSAIQKLNGNITALVTGVSTVYGRSGAVVAIAGDYNTSQVTENTNLYYTLNRFATALAGTTTDALNEGTTNKYFTNARAQNAVTLTTTGTSGAATYVAGTLNVPQYAGSTLITAGTGISTSTSSGGAVTVTNTGVITAFGRAGTVVATAGDYTTALVSEVTNLYFTAARVLSTTLTGYVSGAGTISSADSVLGAIQKLNGNIGALVTGVSSVTAANTTLTISPTAGAVIAGLNLANANTWTGLQQFNGNASTTGLTSTGSTYLATSAGNVGIGTTTSGSLLSLANTANFQSSTSTIYSSLIVAATSAPAFLQVGSGTPIYGYLPNDMVNIIGNRNDYSAFNNYNFTAGNCATADITVANDLTSGAGQNFGDYGHTSSLFTGAGCANNPFSGFAPNSTYNLDPTGNMYFSIGSTSAASYFSWMTGGQATANRVMTLLNNGFLGIGTTSPGSLLSVQGVANFTTATSSFSSMGGVNLLSGCYAVRGTCIGAGGGGSFITSLTTTGTSGAATVVSGVLNIPQYAGGGSNYFTNSGSNTYLSTGSFLSVGTSSSPWLLDVGTSSAGTLFNKGQLGITDTNAGANLKHWLLSSEGGNFYLGTTTDAYATSTTPVFSSNNIGQTGFGTTPSATTQMVVSNASKAAYEFRTQNSGGAFDVSFGDNGVDVLNSIQAQSILSIGGTTLNSNNNGAAVPLNVYALAGQTADIFRVAGPFGRVMTVNLNGLTAFGSTTPSYNTIVGITATSSLSNFNLFNVIAVPSVGATTTALTVQSNANVGIGTSTPTAQLVSIAASSTLATTRYSGMANIIGGIVNGITELFQEIDQWGGLYVGGDIPTVATCGTSPLMTTGSNQRAGAVTVGTGVVTACTISFAHPYAAGSVVHVFINQDTGALISTSAQSITNAGFIINSASTMGGDVISYTVTATQ